MFSLEKYKPLKSPELLYPTLISDKRVDLTLLRKFQEIRINMVKDLFELSSFDLGYTDMHKSLFFDEETKLNIDNTLFYYPSESTEGASNWTNCCKLMADWFLSSSGFSGKYSQSTYKDCPLFSGKARSDCSGYVSSCLAMYGLNPNAVMYTSYMFLQGGAGGKLLEQSGQFKAMPFNKAVLTEGDIVAMRGHVYIAGPSGPDDRWDYGNNRTTMPVKDWNDKREQNPDTVIWKFTGHNVGGVTRKGRFMVFHRAGGYSPYMGGYYQEVSGDSLGRAVYLAKILVQQGGFTKEQASAIAGVYIDENGCNPRSFNAAEKAGKGANGTGGFGYGAGIGSWTFLDTKNRVLNHIGRSIYNTKIEDLDLQTLALMLIRDTVNGPMRTYYNALRRCVSLEDASATAVIITGGVGYSKNWGTHPTPADAMRMSKIYEESNNRRFGVSAYHGHLYERRLSYAQQVFAKL